MNARAARIRAALLDLDPSHLDVFDESANHRAGPDAQTHFKVVIVSAAFTGLSLLERHRAVQARLSAELANGLHALALSTYDPEQWEKQQGNSPASPACRGGSV